ncbi:MAG: copper-binding protein [Hyphococcus sp.]|nr:MAG: copper-binding protein [Marinicaulis sp.]
MDTTRRNFLGTAASAGATLAMSPLIPTWALSASQGNLGLPGLTGSKFDLTIGKFPVRIDDRAGEAVGVNGTIPAPLLRFREGDEITINVKNNLMKDTSIHWHGLLVPFQMDGVPGVSFPGIKPGETFTYKFALPQNGTYWYHSHSGLQEQLGHYGPLIIDPKDVDPVSYDREYVLVLSDWTFENPHRVFAKLKKNSEVYNFQKRTFSDFVDAVDDMGLGGAIVDRSMWGAMRMSPTDIADVTGAAYTYLINGHSTADNWNAVFNVGERVRLRIINASAMTIFNFRIPDLPMSVVASDGLNVRPVETDEFQIGVAETYDVIVEPKESRTFALVAESIDRSGMAVATLGPQPGMRASAPALRERPTLTMRDMGMTHYGAHGAMAMNEKPKPVMIHGGMDHDTMDHGGHDSAEQRHDHKRGAGVDMVAMAPVNRLDEPGLGLENVPHRTLTYTQLRSLDQNPDKREPQREIELHLTGNMERYMWSFDGIKFSEVVDPIVFNEGERVRMTLVNDTMMSHPIHLHGMFFDLVNGTGDHKPRKHTVIVKPGEKLSYDVTADHIGDWAFHCHLLMHMHAGMMQIVSVRPHMAMNDHDMDHNHKGHGEMDHGGKH